MLLHLLFHGFFCYTPYINIPTQLLPFQFHDMNFLHVHLRKKEIQQIKLPLPYFSHLPLAKI